MANRFTHSWHYQVAGVDNSFSIYFNERLIAIITKPSDAHWPVHISINEKMYAFSRASFFNASIYIKDALTGDTLGVIKMPLISSVFFKTVMTLTGGEEYTWYTNSFFSLHWKWKKENADIIDAIENIATKKYQGIIGIKEYKERTDLLIISGFFLSLLKQSRFSFGLRGLKRSRLRSKKIF